MFVYTPANRSTKNVINQEKNAKYKRGEGITLGLICCYNLLVLIEVTTTKLVKAHLASWCCCAIGHRYEVRGKLLALFRCVVLRRLVPHSTFHAQMMRLATTVEV